MTTFRKLTKLGAAYNRQSWEWLLSEAEDIARALKEEIDAGATVDDIRQFTMSYIGREKMAARVEQAAAHLLTEARQEAI